MNEKKSKSLFRNFITPTSEVMFNLGTFITALLAIVIQLILFFAISALFFNISVVGSLASSLLILLLITSVFILLGMIIGFVFKSEETYVLAAITVSALLLFLSSTVMPIESISDSIRAFASVTPFVVSENLLRQVMFFEFGFADLIVDLSVLIGYIAVFAVIIYVIDKVTRMTFTIRRREIKK